MLVHYSQVLSQPVHAELENALCGVCTSVVIDFKDAGVAALIISTRSLLAKKQKVLLLRDVIQWQPTLEVHSLDDIMLPTEVIRMSDMLAKPHSLFHLPTRTKSGRALGIVLDFAFDPISGALMQFFVGRKAWLGEQNVAHIVPRNAVHRLTAKELVVEDSTITAEPQQSEEREDTQVSPDLTPEPSFIVRSRSK